MYDIAVIGGGPGGYTAAIYAAKKGKNVVLIEKKKLGGTCLNVGCIPTKALIHSASLFNEIKEAENFGIKVTDSEIDWMKVQKNKDDIVYNLTNGVKGLLKQNKVKIINGKAQLIDTNTIKISEQNNITEIKAKNIIIATGSEPIIPNIPGRDIEGIITSTEALSLDQIPKKLVVIGGGVIGAEMGYIYNSIGSKVTIIEMQSKILGRMDNECSELVRKQLENDGININTNSKVISFEKADNEIVVKYELNEKIESIRADKVLISIGRKPLLNGIENIGLTIDRKGIVIDEYLKTNKNNIYAIGDVTGKIQLAHVASHQGITAVRNILGEKEKMKYDIVPSCIYTNPEMASVGLTEEEAREKYANNMKVSVFPFSYNGKSLTLGNRKGFFKIITEDKYNQIIGIHIVGPSATEMIAEAVLAMKLECTAEEIANTIHAHPTLSEALMEGAAGINNEAVHIVSSLK